MENLSSHIRTRFAPSPTGFIHLGNLRSALYPWAFARAKGGDFILRIEDTDQERSTQEAVDVIIEGLQWLGLDIDEGPFYQMQRLERYQATLKQMIDAGLAYYCYMSEEELNTLRDAQIANKEKPRYNGTWRPEPGKQLPVIPEGVKPVVRFKNPIDGNVVWKDAVKGVISISNEELDDLVIARPDGTPTYNFCVVVDDLDMKITHVIRGDDHINNTPRQINIIHALGGQVPVYGHLPTVLNEQGEKMSKRNGAMSVRDYQKAGYLPEAILNYLARLGWSHGDAEIFTKEQFVNWFDLDSLGRSPAQHNPEKLLWLNHQYIQNADPLVLAELTKPFAHELGIDTENGPDFVQVVALLKDRANTLTEIAEGAKLFYLPAPVHSAEQIATNIPSEIIPALKDLIEAVQSAEHTKSAYGAAFKEVLAKHQIKMPALAMPVRYALFATTQTPAIDSVLLVLGKDDVLERLSKVV
jgi:glutamyl-tRNA synthetase